MPRTKEVAGLSSREGVDFHNCVGGLNYWKTGGAARMDRRRVAVVPVASSHAGWSERQSLSRGHKLWLP